MAGRPIGIAGAQATPGRAGPIERFVVLEHEWNGVHWDFMLERSGVLKTWAVDLPLEPGRELPARRLADHRIAYLDYEGPISGNRGRVRRIDAGTYETIQWEDTMVQVVIRGGQLAGEVVIRRANSARCLETSWILRLGNLD